MEDDALMNQRSGRMCVGVRGTGSGRTAMFLSVCIAKRLMITVVIDSVGYNITQYPVNVMIMILKTIKWRIKKSF